MTGNDAIPTADVLCASKRREDKPLILLCPDTLASSALPVVGLQDAQTLTGSDGKITSRLGDRVLVDGTPRGAISRQNGV